MIFDVEIDGLSTRLEVQRDGERCRFRLGEQEERSAQLAAVEPGVYSVLLDGRSYEARAEPGEDCAWITIRGHRFRVAITDPRRWSRTGPSLPGQDRENVIASMPGKIVRVLVKPGENVTAGQGILVVEAMKMQNEMKTRRGGTVAAIAVREGETVAAGAVLVTIE
jgi:biotin carboxyl carrier protein